MRKLLSASFVLGLAVFLIGCGAQGTEETAEPVVEETVAVEEAAPVLEMVEVAAEGSTFDPPIEVAQIPDGAWYCPMETVHYAAMEAGTCPECGMELVQKVAEVIEEPAPETVEETPAES